jgi:hypothetical protein
MAQGGANVLGGASSVAVIGTGGQVTGQVLLSVLLSFGLNTTGAHGAALCVKLYKFTNVKHLFSFIKMPPGFGQTWGLFALGPLLLMAIDKMGIGRQGRAVLELELW